MRQRLSQIVQLICTPPARSSLRQQYDIARRDYLLTIFQQHFQTFPNDPAPLLHKSLLDVGCGDATIAEYMALAGAQVCCLEPNQTLRETAITTATKYGTDITFSAEKASQHVQAGHMYDVILCLDVLEYIHNVPLFLWSLQKMLEPDGVMIISGINRTTKAFLLHILFSEYIFRRTLGPVRRWQRFFKPAALQQALEAQGLRVMNTQGLRFQTQKVRWKLVNKPDTRYLMYVTRLK